MITNKDEDSIVQHVIQNKSGIIIHVSVKIKYHRKCKENNSWNPSKCICENSKY